MSVDTNAAVERLMRFLAVEGVTGREALIGREISAALRTAGVPARAIRFDDANKRIPVPTETGNLIVDLPGTGALGNQPRLLFMTHMDTVPLCAGARPKRQGRKIVNTAKTALGGDNRTGCGVLATLAAELFRQKLDHPPITLLFMRARGKRPVGLPPCRSRRARQAGHGIQLRWALGRPTSWWARSGRIAGRWRSSAARRMPAARRSAASAPR